MTAPAASVQRQSICTIAVFLLTSVTVTVAMTGSSMVIGRRNWLVTD
jgi:hypothetical protein